MYMMETLVLRMGTVGGRGRVVAGGSMYPSCKF